MKHIERLKSRNEVVMHRKVSLSAGLSIGGFFLALALTNSPALAAQPYSDSHCFKNAKNTVSYPEDQYATGELQDAEQVAAIEELNQRHWQLRLSETPYDQANRDIREVVLEPKGDEGPRGWWYSSSVIQLDNERRFNEVRSGAKIMQVSPQMKQLARERSEIRNLKRKPCNPNMHYLGTN